MCDLVDAEGVRRITRWRTATSIPSRSSSIAAKAAQNFRRERLGGCIRLCSQFVVPPIHCNNVAGLFLV